MDLLNSMKKKAEGELQDATKAEMNRRQNFELLEQSLSDQIKVDKRNLSENQQLSGQKGESKGQAEGELADANKNLSADSAALADTQNQCKETNANYEMRVKAREEETSTISEAISILSNPDFAAATGEFLQMNDNEDVREQVSNILQSAADKYSSTAFAQLASRARVGDAFGKVKGLIEDMIAKLQKQAVEEANKKAYCDTEKKKGEAERAKLSQRSDLLQTRDDKYSADMAKAKSDIATLAQELSDLADAVREATELRRSAAKQFAKFEKDSNLRIKTIANAIGVLQNYYSQNKSLLQTSAKTHGINDAWESKTGGATGIIGLLETAQADVEKELSQAQANENEEQAAFKKFKNEAEQNTAAKSASKAGKEGELKRLSASREETRQDHESTGKELDAAVEGLAKLRQACVHQPISFEERAQKRADEIESLKEALDLLTPATEFIQKQVTLHRA